MNSAPTDELAALRAWLLDQPDVAVAVVFGSVARGDAAIDSDLDLAVQLDCPMTSSRRSELIAGLAQVCGRPIDLVDLREVGQPLLGSILATGRRLLGGDGAWGELICRDLASKADFLPYRERILDERRRAWLG